MKLMCVNKSGEKLCNAILAQWHASWLKKRKKYINENGTFINFILLWCVSSILL